MLERSAGVQDHKVYLRPDQKIAWVTNNNDGTVSILDKSTDRVIKTIPTGSGPRHTFFSPDGNSLFVTNTGANTVSVIDTDRDEVLRDINVAIAPEGIAFKKP